MHWFVMSGCCSCVSGCVPCAPHRVRLSALLSHSVHRNTVPLWHGSSYHSQKCTVPKDSVPLVRQIFVSLKSALCQRVLSRLWDGSSYHSLKCTVPKDSAPLVTQIFVSLKSALCQRVLSRLWDRSSYHSLKCIIPKQRTLSHCDTNLRITHRNALYQRTLSRLWHRSSYHSTVHCAKGFCPACEIDLRITQKCTVPKDSAPLVTQIFVSLKSVLCQRVLSRLWDRSSYHSVKCTVPKDSAPLVRQIFVSLKSVLYQRVLSRLWDRSSYHSKVHGTKGLCPACETDLRITQKCTVPKDSVLLVTQIFVSLSGVHCIGRTVSHSCHSCIIPCNALYHKESDPLRLQKYHSVQCTEPQRNWPTCVTAISFRAMHRTTKNLTHTCYSNIIPCNAQNHKEFDPLRLQQYHSMQCTEPQRIWPT